MMRLAAVAACAAVAAAQTIPDEDWGYVDVRKGAHSFWWLYGSTAPTPRASTPLVLWLQGGPGASSTGFGNFNEIGPQMLLPGGLTEPRNTTWLSLANLLLIDNPVGTGYSYVDDASLLTTNNTQIAADLVALLTAFVGKYPAFQTAPFYVTCESYGGKMTTGLADALLTAISAGQLTMNFRGIALGDSWISPIDYVQTWAPYLRGTSIMDSRDATSVQATVDQIGADIAAGQWAQATNDWSALEGEISGATDGVNFYNILAWGQAESAATSRAAPALSAMAVAAAPAGADLARLAASYERTVARPYGQRLGDELSTFMNGIIRTHLNGGPGGKVIPDSVTWGGQSNAVFSALSGDFMRPVVDVVDSLLAGGAINVTVYNGQLDLICCTPGTEAWMKKLTWEGMAKFYAARKVAQALPGGGGIPGAFAKQHAQLRMWYILDAGHMVPADQGEMALSLLKSILV